MVDQSGIFIDENFSSVLSDNRSIRGGRFIEKMAQWCSEGQGDSSKGVYGWIDNTSLDLTQKTQTHFRLLGQIRKGQILGFPDPSNHRAPVLCERILQKPASFTPILPLH